MPQDSATGEKVGADGLAVRMRGVSKCFGDLKANDRVDFALRRGTIHGLLGENGAGKTTLMRVLYGMYQPEEGSIDVHGRPVRIDSPSRAIALKINMVHQHFMLVRPFTVAENIVLGLKSPRPPFVDLCQAETRIRELSEKYKLKVDPTARVWQLSVGEQQRVEIMSTIYREVEILILDEPTAVLTPQETRDLFGFLRIMRETGRSIIFISHKLGEVLEITDEVSVLRDGHMIGTVKTNATSRTELTRMMVGRDVLFDFSKSERAPGAVVMKTEGLEALSDRGIAAVKRIGFELRANEILAIAGVDGNGQRELCEVLTGLRPTTGGSIRIDGRELAGGRPMDFIHAGVAYIPEDRRSTGLVMSFALAKNFILKMLEDPELTSNGFIKEKKARALAERLIRQYNIKAPGALARAGDLSGGNQQKVVLARELSGRPKVLIANQPTRGVDIGATEYMRQRLLEQRDRGVAILLVSAELDEVFQLADRIAVIYEGAFMGILDRHEAEVETIGLMMAGVREPAA